MKLHKVIAGAALATFVAGQALAAGHEKAELVVGLASEPSSVDPHYHNLSPNNGVARQIFEALIRTDDKIRLHPGLATSWKPIDDTTWEFKLRQGVKFHDGSPFTADDVVFTLERAGNVPNSPSSFGIFTKGKTVKKIDDFTVHISTEKPFPLMANDLAGVTIVSKKNGEGATTADYNSGKVTIGTGPFKFGEYVPGDRIVLVRNDDYWGEKPQWSKVTLKPSKSGPSRVAALLAGDVDFIEFVPTADLARIEKDENLAVSRSVSSRVIYLHLDHDRDNSPFVKAKDGGDIANPLKKLKVRQALSMAINRPAIVERVMEGVAIPAGQLLPDGFFATSPNLPVVKYDPKGAKAMLAEAGYPDGFQLTLHGPNDRYVNDAKIAEAIGQMLSAIGVKTSVETMPRSVYFSRASRGGPNKTPEFSFILVGWGSGSGEPLSPLRSLLHTYDKERGFGPSNRGRYSNAKVDEIIEKGLATVDEEARKALIIQATDMAIGDVGIIPLHYQVNVWAGKKGLVYKARADELTLTQDIVRK